MTKKLLFSAMLASAITLGANAEGDTKTITVDGRTGATVQEDKKSTEERVAKFMDAVSRFHIGGYGEVAMTRGFYNDNPQRFKAPEEYKNAPGFGKFDIPHAVINMGYDFGKGWSLGTEIEFEHGGTGTAYEKEAEEGGEWESETEKGGEVELEQFWIQKSFADWANLRVGHIVVPVGLNNSAHEPLNFFTVYRPEGENTVLPSTWHQTGIDLWGRYKDFRYELQLLPGLNSDNFTQDKWANEGAATAIEYEVSTKYAVSARIDNYSVKGLRMGISAYYGHTVGNSYPTEEEISKYKGQCVIGSFDFTYNDHNWIVRGQADYGYLGDTDIFSGVNGAYNRTNKKSPTHHTVSVAKNAYAIGIEAGYDFFSQIEKLRKSKQKMYVFGRYDNYSTCADSESKTLYPYCKTQCMTFGVNYMPLKQIVVKADFSKRFYRSGFNNEPSINLGIAYQGWFL